MSGEETPHHHGSHQRLLWSPEPSVSARRGIDAIIIPTARRPAYLAGAVKLAQELGCTLVTLHSGKWTSAVQAARCIPFNVGLIAIDVPEPSRLRLPDWETSRRLADTIFARRTDTSAKRNLALMLSYMLDWTRVLFLDDDMTGLNAADVLEASALLDDYNAVGLRNVGFPDNSVVCHAFRDAGGQQQSFIGGGALAVRLDRNKSFFPDIYNEDWFFLLDGDKGLQATAIAGHVVQDPYDPFRTPHRARGEELGDVLAEGLFWLLDQGQSIVDADQKHWTMFLDRRREFIGHVLQLVEKSNIRPDEKRRRIAALKGSLGRLALISPQLCEEYFQAWTSDQERWRRHRGLLSATHTKASALAALSRKGLPRLNWQLGGQSPDREFKEFTPIRSPSQPADGVRLARWSPRPTALAHLAGIADVAATIDRSEGSLI